MLLDVRNVSKTYHGKNGDVRALQGVSLSVDAGDFVGVMGPSGCGRTTLLMVAVRLLAAECVDVVVHGGSPYALAANSRAGLRADKVGFVFQQFHLVPYLNVLDNVMAAAIASGTPDASERARELISRFGLEGRMHHVPGQLSTGERQRAAL